MNEAVHDDTVSGIADIKVRKTGYLQELPCLFQSQSHSDRQHDHLVSGRVRFTTVEDLICIVSIQVRAGDDLIFLKLLFAEQHIEVFRYRFELQFPDFFLEKIGIALFPIRQYPV